MHERHVECQHRNVGRFDFAAATPQFNCNAVMHLAENLDGPNQEGSREFRLRRLGFLGRGLTLRLVGGRSCGRR